ncbi:hypothetical protein SLS57_008899 [Botryosphaeria dothidea]
MHTSLSQSNGALGQFHDGAFPLDDLQTGDYGIQPQPHPQPQVFGVPQSFDQSLGFNGMPANTITGFEMPESLNFGVGPSQEMAFPAPFPANSCNIAMLEHYNAFTHGYVGQPGAQSEGVSAGNGFRSDWAMDDLLFPLPGQTAHVQTGQPDYGLGASLRLMDLTEQTWVAPSANAGLQPPAAFQPTGDQNTLAHARRVIRIALPQIDAPDPQSAPAWEMRNDKYFCLHAGCRNPSFKRLGDLERHQNNVHTQTKSFWCRSDDCDRGRPFPRKDKRNEHERRVHGIARGSNQ